MTWIRIDDHRINVDEIVEYSKPVGGKESENAEIQLSNGNSVFVTATPEDIDVMMRRYSDFGPPKNNA